MGSARDAMLLLLVFVSEIYEKGMYYSSASVIDNFYNMDQDLSEIVENFV